MQEKGSYIMKQVLKILSVFLLIIIISGAAIAVPQLKIKDTNLDCDKNYVNNGYSGCTLEVDLMIEDYSYTSKYDNYTYKVECDATFEYLEANGFMTMSNNESEYINIYGTNMRKTLDIRTSFYSFNPVYKVNVSSLSCKVKDVY